ncbi:hypothetical protein NK553_20880 [Pseudomonas sp. ZM23]|uniref:IacB n=1 Tax=Pseudomonas triclosanedens TaxID=2961893 RepID=A0ABY7A598_9PSED|nr:hypothetical protein [Pseudomonas triclosanedens]MCP8466415.1 hypothetical protein [Pseudomonas triclosanedens]MCP8473183.1 hypothetical protein [Pseudomonas triclosanedens]MCP8479061.1 hypothetical protein [Pseudomonas triclosanedens]WAI52171.1 hypothetical protein OU419_13270 [Pseudomonas triclosanedens]
MTRPTTEPLRVLFCIGIAQPFFDLPTGEGITVWKGFSKMMSDLGALPGMNVLGVLDDDRLMVGPSTTSPWTVYIMADVDCHQTVIDACNLFRTTPVGEYSLWKYAKVEARIGRPLTIPEAART